MQPAALHNGGGAPAPTGLTAKKEGAAGKAAKPKAKKGGKGVVGSLDDENPAAPSRYIR
jgi:hypothetical protein